MSEFVIGMILGTLAGVAATVLSEPLVHFFRRRSFLNHLRTDLRNIDRHFSIVHGEMDKLSEEPQWLQRSRLRWSTFAARGLFTHNHHDLFMLREKEADEIVRFLISVHNYDSTSDEVLATLHNGKLEDGQVEELARRANNLATRARKLKALV